MADYKFISKKIMRKKDFACLKEKKAGYKSFRAPKESFRKNEILFRTPRGWFLSIRQGKNFINGEISIPAAQMWLDTFHIGYNTGWN